MGEERDDASGSRVLGIAGVQGGRKLTFLADNVKGEGLIEVDSEQRTTLSLRAARKPAIVLVDGASAGFTFDARTGMSTMTLPPGHHTHQCQVKSAAFRFRFPGAEGGETFILRRR